MTFPNHISIATGAVYGFNRDRISPSLNLGMYQEEHGIVHNTFFDRLLNKTISMGRDR